VPHHLMDFLEPTDQFTVKDFQNKALATISSDTHFTILLCWRMCGWVFPALLLAFGGSLCGTDHSRVLLSLLLDSLWLVCICSSSHPRHF